MTSERLRKRALSEPEVAGGAASSVTSPRGSAGTKRSADTSGSESVLTNTERAQLEQDITDMKAELAMNAAWGDEGQFEGVRANRARIRGVLEREIRRCEELLAVST